MEIQLLSIIGTLILMLIASIGLNTMLGKKIKKADYSNCINNGFIKNVPLGFYFWDPKKRIEQFSFQSMNNIFFSLNKFAEQFADGNILKEHLAMAKEKSHKFTFSLVSKDRKRYIKCTGSSIIKNDINVIGVIIFIEDQSANTIEIMDLKSAIQGLKMQLKLMEEMLSLASYIIWRRDKNLTMLYSNIAYKDIKMPHNELALAKAALETGIEQTEKSLFIIEDQCIPYKTTIIPTGNGILGFAHNIEEQSQLEKQMKHSNASRLTLFNSMATAISLYGNTKRLNYYNNEFVKFWQFDTQWLDTYPHYTGVMEKMHQKHPAIPEDLDLTSVITAQNKIITLDHETQLHINVVPYPLGETIITYDYIKKLPNNTATLAQALYSLTINVNTGNIVKLSEQFYHVLAANAPIMQQDDILNLNSLLEYCDNPCIKTHLTVIKDKITEGNWDNTLAPLQSEYSNATLDSEENLTIIYRINPKQN